MALGSSSIHSVFLQDVLPAGTCSGAVDTMAFHREKMNEYLCRRYLAQEIVEEAGNGLEKRALPLMRDEGSYRYQDWLARSSTLEDLYRHYEQQGAGDAPIGSAVPSGSYGAPAQGGYESAHQGAQDAGGYDGEVTGYAMVGNKDAGGYGYGTSYQAPTPSHSKTFIKGGHDKGMKLQDLFMLALTAVAFLAFGTFIIEVCMCLMDVKEETAQQTMVTIMRRTQQQVSQQNQYPVIQQYQASPQSQFQVNPQSQYQASQLNQYQPIKYFKSGMEGDNRRSARVLQLENYLEGLAGRATATLDSMELSHQDGGVALGQALCRASSFSRNLTGTSRIWLPLWSFGMSWIGGRHIGTLPLLTATVQGLAGANCSAVITNRL